MARKHGIPVIEDAACAIGSEILWDGRWEKIGRPHGDVACFSFHPRKVISTGDGGMITTANAEWDRQFRLLRQHAMSVPDTVRHGVERGHLRVLPDRWLQLPHDRHPGGGRSRTAQAPGRDGGAAAPLGRALCRIARWHGGLVDSAGAGMGPHQLAKLLRASVAVLRPAQRDAGHARSAASARAAGSCAATASPPTGALRCATRCTHSERAQDRCILLPLYPEMTLAEQEQVAAALASACDSRLREAADQPDSKRSASKQVAHHGCGTVHPHRHRARHTAHRRAAGAAPQEQLMSQILRVEHADWRLDRCSTSPSGSCASRLWRCCSGRRASA